MAENLPGPYEIEYELQGWVSPARSHVLRFFVAAVGSPAPGSLPTAVDIQKMGGATAKLNVVANQIWGFIRTIYHTSISAVGYTLWRYVPGTLAKDFISAGALTTPAGTSGSPTTIAGQITLTFRSANGGVLKIVMLETVLGGDARITLIPNPVGIQAPLIASYVLSADNVLLARDDAFPVAAMRDSRGQNERIWRDVFR
jgi:hypothetical protein